MLPLFIVYFVFCLVLVRVNCFVIHGRTVKGMYRRIFLGRALMVKKNQMRRSQKLNKTRVQICVVNKQVSKLKILPVGMLLKTITFMWEPEEDRQQIVIALQKGYLLTTIYNALVILFAFLSSWKNIALCLQVRREKISERMRLLQELVPGCNKVIGESQDFDWSLMCILYIFLIWFYLLF